MDNGNDHVLQDAVRTATALKYGISGPIAAADLVWQQKKNIGMILGSTAFFLILPVLFLCMLPSFIFGSFQLTTAWNDNAVMMQNIQTDHPAKLPIHGDHPIELDKGMGMPVILEALARVDFSAPDKFDRMLMLEMRRMRKVGCTVVVSARLNSRMVDVMVAMRRMGPYLRLYLITFDPDDQTKLPMISKLQSAGIEVCYVTPVEL